MQGHVRLDKVRDTSMSTPFHVRSRTWVPLLSLAIAGCLAAGAVVAFDPPPAPPAIVAMVDRGDFKAADAAIDAALKQNPDAATQRALAFERERMRRIRLDFPHDEAKIRADVTKQIPDLRDDEFAKWDDANLLEHMSIDGQKVYFQRAVGNLWRLSPEAIARRAEPPKFTDSPLEKLHPHHQLARKTALETGKSSVLPHRR